jgi:hypothetical protein
MTKGKPSAVPRYRHDLEPAPRRPLAWIPDPQDAEDEDENRFTFLRFRDDTITVGHARAHECKPRCGKPLCMLALIREYTEQKERKAAGKTTPPEPSNPEGV